MGCVGVSHGSTRGWCRHRQPCSMATTIIPLRLETSKRYFAALKWLKFRKNPFQKAAEGPRFRAFALRLRTERDLGDRDVDKWSLRLVVERGVLAFECRNWSHLSQVDVLEFVGRFATNRAKTTASASARRNWSSSPKPSKDTPVSRNWPAVTPN